MKVVRKNNNRDRMKLLRRTYQQENPDGQPAMNSTLNSIRKEIALMQKLRHANVVRLVEVLDNPSDEKIYIGMHIWTSSSSKITDMNWHIIVYCLVQSWNIFQGGL